MPKQTAQLRLVEDPSVARLSDFELFWECYPRKRSKLDAARAWHQVAGDRPELELVLAAIDARIQSGEWSDERFIPYPATWLRDGGFLDDG